MCLGDNKGQTVHVYCSSNMAQFSISPPQPFNPSEPENWEKWSIRWKCFFTGSGLGSKDETVQVDTLIYCMGEEAEAIFQSFNLTAEEQKKYQTVLDKFANHFARKKNVIYERTKFNSRFQAEGESVEAFINELISLARFCEYGGLKEEMIRDRIVVGIRDARLSERLQMDAELTLQKCLDQVRQSEQVKKQQGVVRPSSTSIDAVKSRPQHRKLNRNKNSAKGASENADTCGRCGNSPSHNREKCPAKQIKCHKCGKLLHFASLCRAMSIREVTDEESSNFLGVIQAVDIVNSLDWTTTIDVGGRETLFKIDTGADVTVFPDEMYTEAMGKKQPPDRSLLGAGKVPLSVTAMVSTRLVKNNKSALETLYLVEGLEKPLLGKPAIKKLAVVQQCYNITVEDAQDKWPKYFKGLGELDGQYHITLKSNANPFALAIPRRIAIPLVDKVKAALDKMLATGVIEWIEEPADWCAGIVVVPKPDGTVRICVDLTKLNEAVRRELFIMPAVEETLAKLKAAKIFTKLDANNGFWQVKLDPASAKLTTFITPFGRFYFKRLPYGLNAAPEYFMKRMYQVLEGLEGVVCQVDDILVYGDSEAEHDQRLSNVLKRLEEAQITLNKKCVFSAKSVHYLGHIIDQEGIHPDPEKLAAIAELEPPTDITGVRSLLGMVNHLGKFIPNLADLTKPIRDLLVKTNDWIWGEAQKSAFAEIKRVLQSNAVLKIYDPKKETLVSADASSYGIGAVILQRQPEGNVFRPIACASRALTSTESKYAQIEKEALAMTWACERFSMYLLGKKFEIETDHKPLVPLFSTKLLDELPARVQRFRIRLMKYHFNIHHVPGKKIATADVLSRFPRETTHHDEELEKEANACVNLVQIRHPASDQRLHEIRQHLAQDGILCQVMNFCLDGWPSYGNLPGALQPYCQVSGELTVSDGLLLKGSRLVIPVSRYT